MESGLGYSLGSVAHGRIALVESRAEGMVSYGGRQGSATQPGGTGTRSGEAGTATGGTGTRLGPKGSDSFGGGNTVPPSAHGGPGSGCGRQVRRSASRLEDAIADVLFLRVPDARARGRMAGNKRPSRARIKARRQSPVI